jgi:pimeloyl-ACP methyl ester carboxylesterase
MAAPLQPEGDVTMTTKTLTRTFVILAALGISGAACMETDAAPASAAPAPPPVPPPGATAPVKSGYAAVNGLAMYYQIRGAGKPLVVIHGGFGNIEMFGELLPTLARTRQVIGVELQAHGHTADIDRPFSYEQFADDTAALIGQLGVGAADVFGYSLGGGVAQQLAIRHPEVVHKLVIASAPFRQDGWYPEVLAGIGAVPAQEAPGFPPYDAYVRVAPRPADWVNLVNKTKQMLTGPAYDWTSAVAAIKAPALIVVADSDSVRPAHALEMFQLLGGGVPGDFGKLPASQLAVLPGTAHSVLPMRVESLAAIIPPFLDAPAPPVQ